MRPQTRLPPFGGGGAGRARPPKVARRGVRTLGVLRGFAGGLVPRGPNHQDAKIHVTIHDTDRHQGGWGPWVGWPPPRAKARRAAAETQASRTFASPYLACVGCLPSQTLWYAARAEGDAKACCPPLARQLFLCRGPRRFELTKWPQPLQITTMPNPLAKVAIWSLCPLGSSKRPRIEGEAPGHFCRRGTPVRAEARQRTHNQRPPCQCHSWYWHSPDTSPKCGGSPL